MDFQTILHHHRESCCGFLHITNSAGMNLSREQRKRYITVMWGKEDHAKGVRIPKFTYCLLLLFLLEMLKMKKRKRGKGKRLMPITTNIWKKQQKNPAGQVPGFRGQRPWPPPGNHQPDRVNSTLPYPVHSVLASSAGKPSNPTSSFTDQKGLGSLTCLRSPSCLG